jgi:type IV secretory pathway VirB10-like protein
MPQTPDTPQIHDWRTKIVSALPRNAQAKTIGTLALLMILVILFSGHTTPRKVAPPAPATSETPPDPGRIDDYRKRIEDEMRRLALEEAELARTKKTLNVSEEGPESAARVASPTSASAAPVDPTEAAIEADRTKRDYQSLYASNIALSYRRSGAPEIERPAASEGPKSAAGEATPAKTTPPADGRRQYRLFEGTVLETVLTNRLESAFAGPVNCMVSTPIFDMESGRLLIPQGARVLGEVRKLENFGEQRLAVFFHRLIMPNGSSITLDKFQALDPAGSTGLHDQINHHYFQIFGVSIAIGAIAGLAQRNTSYGLDESAAEAYQQGMSSSLSQSALHILDRYLNVLPTITIREGHRVDVYLSQDLLLPEYVGDPSKNTN